jgi:hypothetical protein
MHTHLHTKRKAITHNGRRTHFKPFRAHFTLLVDNLYLLHPKNGSMALKTAYLTFVYI